MLALRANKKDKMLLFRKHEKDILCSLTRQSSCRKHQVIVIFSYSWHSLKDTDQCSSLSNTMYQVQGDTPQPPAVEKLKFSIVKGVSKRDLT